MSDSQFVRPIRTGDRYQEPGSSALTDSPPAARVRRRAGPVGLGLLLVPVLEIAVAVAVGRVIGALATVLLVLVGCVAGILLLRRLGAGAVRRLATSGGYTESAPRRSAGETGLMVLSGLLLAFPGLVTDVVGLFLLLPPVRRAVVRRTGTVLAGRLQRFDVRGVRVVQGQIIGMGGPGEPSMAPVSPRAAAGDADQVDIQVIQVRDVDPPTQPRPHD